MKKAGWFFLGVFILSSPISAQELPVFHTFTGDYPLVWTPGKSSGQTPAPRILRNSKELEIFKQGLPKYLSSGPKSQKPRAYQDELTQAEIQQWETRMLVVVFQDSSREGPVIVKSLKPSGSFLEGKLAVWSRGVESRELDRGFYTAFWVPQVPGALKIEWVPSGFSTRWEIRSETPDETGPWGLWDLDARTWAVKPQWEQAGERDGAMNFLGLDQQGWGLFNPQGQLLLRPYLFDNGPDYFEEGLARFVDSKGKMGFFDRTGRVIVAPQFEFAWPFEGGHAQVARKVKFVKEGEHQRIVPEEVNLINPLGQVLGPWKKP